MNGSFVDVYRADGVPFSLSKQLLGEDRVRIRMTTPRRGYVSVGWAPSSVSVAHKQMDTVVGWLDESTGKVVVIDAFSDAKSAAKDDVKLAMGANNIVDPTGSFSDADGLVIEFTRLRNTGDPNDQVFAPNASVFLQWAVHDKPCTAAFVCAKHTSGNAAIVGNVDMLAQLAPSGPVELPPQPYGGLQAGDILLIIVAIYLVLAILVRWLFKCLRYLSYRRQYQVQLARTSVAATPGRRDPDGGDIAPAYSDAAPIEWNTSYLAPLPPPLFRQSAYQRQDASPWKPVDTVYGGGGAWAPNDQAQSAFSPTFRPLPPPPQPLHAPANGDPPPAAPFGAGGAIVRRTVRFADGVGSGDAWDAALDAPRKSRHQFDGGASRKSLRCTVYEMSSEGAVERPNVLSNLTHALTHARVYGTMIPVHSVALALVFVLVIVLIVFLFPADTWTWADSMGHVAGAVGLLTALPATRNSLLCWLLDMHFDATIMYHRWLGRLAVFLAFVHLVAYFATGVDGWSPPDASHILTEKYLFGFVAFAAGLWIVVTAFDTVRRLQFEFFYWSHFAFLLWYVFSALHSPVCAIYAYVAAGIYALDRLVRFFWGLWPRRAILQAKEGGVVFVRWPKHPLARYDVGNYVFLNFPGFSLLQWHPFTLASGPHDPFNEVAIKNLGDFTTKLHDVVKAQGANAQLWVRCDGPYGRFTIDFRRFQTVVVVGGGVGVTPCIATLRDIFRVDMTQEDRMEKARHTINRNVFFIWSCANVATFHWFKDVIERCEKKSSRSGYARLHLYIYATREASPPAPMIAGRPDLDEIYDAVEEVAENQPVASFVCGPDQMVTAVWDQCSYRTAQGRTRYYVHHEIFNF
jgi:predicted ferric reductase